MPYIAVMPQSIVVMDILPLSITIVVIGMVILMYITKVIHMLTSIDWLTFLIMLVLEGVHSIA